MSILSPIPTSLQVPSVNCFVAKDGSVWVCCGKPTLSVKKDSEALLPSIKEVVCFVVAVIFATPAFFCIVNFLLIGKYFAALGVTLLSMKIVDSLVLSVPDNCFSEASLVVKAMQQGIKTLGLPTP